jgi:hypothetical protein
MVCDFKRMGKANGQRQTQRAADNRRTEAGGSAAGGRGRAAGIGRFQAHDLRVEIEIRRHGSRTARMAAPPSERSRLRETRKTLKLWQIRKRTWKARGIEVGVPMKCPSRSPKRRFGKFGSDYSPQVGVAPAKFDWCVIPRTWAVSKRSGPPAPTGWLVWRGARYSNWITIFPRALPVSR